MDICSNEYGSETCSDENFNCLTASYTNRISSTVGCISTCSEPLTCYDATEFKCRIMSSSNSLRKLANGTCGSCAGNDCYDNSTSVCQASLAYHLKSSSGECVTSCIQNEFID